MLNNKLILNVSTLVLTLIFFHQSAFALSLDQALKEALENSPVAQASHAEAELAGYGTTEALSAFLPKLAIQAEHYFKIKYQVLDVNLGPGPAQFPLVTPATVYGLNASWSLFNGFQDIEHLQAAKLEKEAAEEDLNWAEFNLQEEVRLSFAQILAARQLEAVAAENIRNLEAHLKQIDVRLRAGTALEVDQLRVQVQLQNALSQQVNAHDNVVIGQQKLAQLLGKTSDSRTIEGEIPIPDEAMATQIQQAAFEERADLKALSLKNQALEKDSAAATHYWIPSLSLVGNYSFYNNRTNNLTRSDDFRSAYQWGIQLNWNIFDGLLSYARAKEAALKTVIAVKQEQSTRLQASTDHINYQNQYRYQLTQYLAQVENLARSKRSVDLALAGQRAGTERNVDVLDAELDLFQARAGVIQAQLAAYTAKINFDQTIGRSL